MVAVDIVQSAGGRLQRIVARASALFGAGRLCSTDGYVWLPLVRRCRCEEKPLRSLQHPARLSLEPRFVDPSDLVDVCFVVANPEVEAVGRYTRTHPSGLAYLPRGGDVVVYTEPAKSRQPGLLARIA